MNDELNFENNKPQVSFGNTTENIQFKAPQNVVGGTTNYKVLSNKPKINGVELVDDKTLEELGIQPIGNYASEEYVQDQVKNIDIPEVDLSNYYTKEDIDGLPSNRIMLGDGSPSISLHRSQNISLVDYMKTIDKRGLYSCYVQSGILDNPPKASSSLRGIFEIYFTKKENGNMIAWIILFDEAGQMHTRYVKGTASEWATNGLPDNTLTKEGISADAKAVGDKITELNNSISAKASIEDMTNYIEENKEDLKGDKGDKGDTGEKGQDGKNGANGTNGVDGKTPVKGTDYYTEADKQEMVSLVLAALPSSEGVSY